MIVAVSQWNYLSKKITKAKRTHTASEDIGAICVKLERQFMQTASGMTIAPDGFEVDNGGIDIKRR